MSEAVPMFSMNIGISFSTKVLTMMFFHYSEQMMRMTEAKGVKLPIVIAGIVIGGCLVVGFFAWNNSLSHRIIFHEEYLLAQENAFLQHRVLGVSRMLDDMEYQLIELHEYDSGLNILVQQPLSAADSLSRIRVFRETARDVK